MTWSADNGKVLLKGREVPAEQLVKRLQASDELRRAAVTVVETHSRMHIWRNVAKLKATLEETLPAWFVTPRGVEGNDS